jgi:S-adenosylmethionine:tRNA ribosyltransferase-isomerase
MADLDYPLPPEAIAQHPVEPRDAARLLVDRGPDRVPEHRHVHDLPDLLHEGDVVVVNDTRVLPARLFVTRASGGRVEVLLVRRLDAAGRAWEALVRPSRKIAPGERLAGEGFGVVVGVRTDDGARRLVEIDAPGDPVAALLAHGQMPLPPYITATLDDPERYQTVYARRAASAAAPTAGLHLTGAVLDRLRDRGVEVLTVELVVGLDTFKPVTVDDPAEHVIHTEEFRVDPAVLARCLAAERVVAVGTTSVRALESAAAGITGERTNLFIRRPYDWKVVDVLLTNFHLPRTTLLLMIDAFVGPRWRQLYDLALAERYRFLSFGDAMLLQREWVAA